MKAMVYSKKNTPRGMRLTEVEKPAPAAGQVLVKIHSVSLNAADYRSMQMGIGPKSGIFGADIAGLVEAVGPDTKKFKVGDSVFGDLSVSDFGGLAEYVAAPENLVAKKPDSVSFEHAAAIPMASLTALQGLRDKGGIKPGHRVLLIGASGGVGLFAIQLAKYFGALSQIARFFLLGPLLSIGKRKMRILAAKASAEDLTFVMKLVEEGRIRPVIDRRYSLPEAGEAFEYLKAGHAAGKVVINVIP